MDEQDSSDDGGMQWFEEVGRRQQMQETQTERKRVIMAGLYEYQPMKNGRKRSIKLVINLPWTK